MKPGSAVEMPGGGRRWKTLVSRYGEFKLDIEFPTVVHRPWKSLRDSHIPTAPTIPCFSIPKQNQNPKERSPAPCLPHFTPSGPFLD